MIMCTLRMLFGYITHIYILYLVDQFMYLIINNRILCYVVVCLKLNIIYLKVSKHFIFCLPYYFGQE